MNPELCKLTTEPFCNPDWIWERKFDGTRIIADTNYHTLTARSGSDKTEIFPELDISTTTSAILDGEVISADGLSFQECIQHRVNRYSFTIDFPTKYMVFDIMEVDGEDICGLELSNRKDILSEILIPSATCQVVEYYNDGIALYKQAIDNSWEGVVGKNLRSLYEEGKRRWLKIKVWQHGQFWVVGFTNGTGKRSGVIGALELEDNNGNYVGKVGTGFNDLELMEITKMASNSKFKVDIKYLEYTNSGILRFPVYNGLVKGGLRNE